MSNQSEWYAYVVCFRQGVDAWLDGEPKSSNPYPLAGETVLKATNWLQGWAAQDAYVKRKKEK